MKQKRFRRWMITILVLLAGLGLLTEIVAISTFWQTRLAERGILSIATLLLLLIGEVVALIAISIRFIKEDRA